MSLRAEVFRIKSGYIFLIWFTVLLIIFSTVMIPYKIATLGQTYPDLDILLICFSAGGFLWIGLLYEFGKKTAIVKLTETDFTVNKFGQKAHQHPYTAILTHNERHESGRGGPFDELTIYLADNWFAIRSNEFAEYHYLKDQFTQYGQSVPYRTVLTPIERNRFRWMIGGLVLLIGATIAFGYVAHNPANPNPARLISLTSTVDQIRESKKKGQLKGVTIRLRAFPNFAFYVSRRHYDVRLETLKSVIRTNRPITLLIRQSEFRKKLRKTEPLTFGDKYVDYNQIMVFGVNQGDSVDILTPGPVYEPTHTNPGQRAFLLSILLLLCWTGWVYIDRQVVLRAI
jgi:hypothetical protein